MLTELAINNFAIVEQLELELGPGLTVLTGETGAGKSILFDALALALGQRADKDTVRHGQARAEVVARFDLSARPALVQQLTEQDLDPEDGLILRRVIGADGRSRGYVNGTPAPASTLRDIATNLVEIHGQHEHQSLSGKARQLGLLDAFANHVALLSDTRSAFDVWQRAGRELDALRAELALSPAEAELLQFQREELADLADDATGFEQLLTEHGRLANADALLEATAAAIHATDGEGDSACRLLADAQAALTQRADLDPELGGTAELLDSALIQAREAAVELARYRDGLEVDSGRLREFEDRLGALHDAARKHRVEIEDLPQKLHQLEQRLRHASDAEQREQELVAAVELAAGDYQRLAQELSIARIDAGSRLSDQVTEAMQQLGMSGGQFEVVVDYDVERPLRPQGLDDVRFMVTANPGQPLQPLSKVASGGELSRISLAIKVALIAVDDPGTLIFDEVDAGVGGAIAEIVGQKLRQVAADRQVFCITHLPQVAACGHQHLCVSKQRDQQQTSTEVAALDDESRTAEIARMLGGVEITAKTTAHAAEMIRGARR